MSIFPKTGLWCKRLKEENTLRALVLLLCCLSFMLAPMAVVAGDAGETSAATGVVYERDFVRGPFGQVHILTARPAAATDLKTPLALFHPTPYSSDYFRSFIAHMARDRVVIAIDTPGYGDSAKPPDLQPIAGYARSAAIVLQVLGYGRDEKVDVLGYHTGALIAAELAAQRLELVRRMVLPGVPFYADEEKQREAYEKYVKAPTLATDGAHLSEPWDFSSFTMQAGVTLERAQAHFNDYMQCYPDCWHAYHAVFTYDGKARFQQVAQPVLLMSFTGSLDQETEAAGAYFQDAAHMRFENIKVGGFDLAPEQIAAAARQFLD